jgi:surface antigen
VIIRSAGTATLGVALVATLVLGGGAVTARADTIVCVDDGCDSGLWQAARGASNQVSYWGMGAGHDCTNYVAWKLITNGVSRPRTGPGNAADWATRAAGDGYLVDRIPAVGAVAQWNAYADGNPAEGHVAYVEKVNGDGTILVSEDSWHADGTGPLRFRIVDVASVSNFIHYGDTAAWLRQVVAGPSVWNQRSTGVRATVTQLSAVSMGGRAPQVAYVQDGQLFVASSDSTGWHAMPTGIASQARALSAVNMGGLFPTILSLEGNRLVITTHGPRGWVSMYTGVDISGEMSAVNAGGLWPTVMVSQGGDLYRVDNAGSGWFVQATGVESTGPISAVSTGGSTIDAYSAEGGVLYRLWFDGSWWHRDSTGIPSHGAISATALDRTSQVVLAQDGTLSLAYSTTVSWVSVPLGVAAGTSVAAVDMGGIYPVVIQAG